MTFTVHELPVAKSDKRAILAWLFERSPQGGRAWLKAYDDALARLEKGAGRFGAGLAFSVLARSIVPYHRRLHA